MKWLLILLISVICIPIKAQIYITPFIPDEIISNYPDAAKMLESKLNNILSANDIKTQMGDSRFVLTGNWIPETKDIVGTLNERGYNDNFDLLQHNKATLRGVTKVTATQDTIIGEFSKGGTLAYMITNVAEPSSGLTDKVVMTLASGRKAQIYINGQMTEKDIINNQIAVTLKAGEAAFVVVAD